MNEDLLSEVRFIECVGGPACGQWIPSNQFGPIMTYATGWDEIAPGHYHAIRQVTYELKVFLTTKGSELIYEFQGETELGRGLGGC